MLFFLYLTTNSIKWYRRFALLTEMRNFSQRFTCIIKSKKFIFLKLMIFDLIVSIATCLTVFSTTTTAFALMIAFFALNFKATFDLMIDSKYNSVDVDLNEIDREEINFELFEIDIESELAMKKTSSNFDLIEIELELKLIVNFSNLNNLKNLLNMILKRDLKLTTTSFVSRWFWILRVTEQNAF